MGAINVTRTCDLLSAKLEVTYQRMGFWLGCVAVAGLFVQSLSGKISRQSNQIKSNQNNYHLQYEDKNATALRKIRFTVL